MHGYFRVLSRDASADDDPEIQQKITAFMNAAPGIRAVKSVEPHGRGGFSVVVDRDDELPDSFASYFEAGDYMLVI
jgi:hypothetical protein